ncbi:MAG: nucleotide exchange factor GrpE [Candidatus Woesearchaeota archaeon]|nr:nucleotide exchange factor GrpE [Candidatus Woesearchaeota archaeon]
MQFMKRTPIAQSVPETPKTTEIKKSVEVQESQNKQIEENAKQLKKELEARDKTIEEYGNHLKRLQADFENYMKRTTKEKLDMQNLGASRIMTKMLATIDDFERALANTGTLEEFKKGIQMVFNHFKKTLYEEGLAEIPITEKPDPYKHEVILQQPSTQTEGSILTTLQKGYTFKNVVLRCAKVSIATGKSTNKEVTNTTVTNTEINTAKNTVENKIAKP